MVSHLSAWIRLMKSAKAIDGNTKNINIKYGLFISTLAKIHFKCELSNFMKKAI